MNYNRDFKGVWIPKEIWLNKELKIMEKIFLVEIDSLDNDQGCFASNGYFSEFFGLTKQRCSQIINSLLSKEYISIEYQRKGKEIIKRTIRVSNKFNRVSNKCEQGIKKSLTRYKEKFKGNNTVNNTVNNTKKKNEIISEEFLKYLEELSVNDLVYNIENQKVKLKQKHENTDIYICFKKKLIYVNGREFDNIQGFLDNDYANIKIKNEVYLLNNEFQKDNNVEKLILSLEAIKQMKEKQESK